MTDHGFKMAASWAISMVWHARYVLLFSLTLQHVLQSFRKVDFKLFGWLCKQWKAKPFTKTKVIAFKNLDKWKTLKVLTFLKVTLAGKKSNLLTGHECYFYRSGEFLHFFTHFTLDARSRIKGWELIYASCRSKFSLGYPVWQRPYLLSRE